LINTKFLTTPFIFLDVSPRKACVKKFSALTSKF